MNIDLIDLFLQFLRLLRQLVLLSLEQVDLSICLPDILGNIPLNLLLKVNLLLFQFAFLLFGALNLFLDLC